MPTPPQALGPGVPPGVLLVADPDQTPVRIQAWAVQVGDRVQVLAGAEAREVVERTYLPPRGPRDNGGVVLTYSDGTSQTLGALGTVTALSGPSAGAAGGGGTREPGARAAEEGGDER